MHGRPGRARLRRLQAAPPGTWLLRAGMWPQPEILVWAVHRGLWGRGLHGTCRGLELWGREGLEKQPRGTGCREPRPSRGGDLGCDVAPRPLLVAPGHPSTGKTSRRRQHQQRKKAACRTRVTRGGPAWTARRPRRPFSALQTSPEPLDPLWGSGRGWQRAPRATPASGSVAWSLGGRSLQPLPPPPPLEGVAVRITRARQVRVASPAPGGGWGSVAGLWPQVVFLPRNPRCPPDRLAVALKDRAAKARAFVDRPWPETCVTPTPSRLADARPARPCASRPEPRAAATRPSAGGAPEHSAACAFVLCASSSSRFGRRRRRLRGHLSPRVPRALL